MKTQNSDFPNWHQQPLKLTKQEITNPNSVIKDFFDHYNLLDARLTLKHWLRLSSNQQDENFHDVYMLYAQMQKLIEATWMINIGNEFNSPPDDQPCMDITNIDRSVRLVDQIKTRPLSCLFEIFNAFHLTDYVKALMIWKDQALGEEGGIYEAAERRSRLITFVKEAVCLTEAMFLITKDNLEEQKGKSVKELAPEIQAIGILNDTISFLNEEQRTKPLSVVTGFFQKSGINHVRKEFRDLFSIALFNEGSISDFYDLLLHEYLECLFEIAYTFRHGNAFHLLTSRLSSLYEYINIQPPALSTDFSTNPGWQNSPVLLCTFEIEHPQSVFQEVFKHRSLPDIRTTLKRWVESIAGQETISHGDFLFRDNIEKLIEAAWLTLKKRENAPNDVVYNADGSKLKEDNYQLEEQSLSGINFNRQIENEEEQRSVFNKQRFYLDDIEGFPLSTVCRIFKSSCDDSLKFTIKDWQLLILNNDFGERYNYKHDMAILIPFCENLQKLIEALYLLCVPLTNDDQYDPLHLNENYFFLNKEEQANPYIVIKSFREHFPFQYAQAELWDMVNAIVTVPESQKIRRSSIIWNFEQFLCIIKAAYLLVEEDAALLADLNRLQTERKQRSFH